MGVTIQQYRTKIDSFLPKHRNIYCSRLHRNNYSQKTMPVLPRTWYWILAAIMIIPVIFSLQIVPAEFDHSHDFQNFKNMKNKLGLSWAKLKLLLKLNFSSYAHLSSYGNCQAQLKLKLQMDTFLSYFDHLMSLETILKKSKNHDFWPKSQNS